MQLNYVSSPLLPNILRFTAPSLLLLQAETVPFRRE